MPGRAITRTRSQLLSAIGMPTSRLQSEVFLSARSSWCEAYPTPRSTPTFCGPSHQRTPTGASRRSSVALGVWMAFARNPSPPAADSAARTGVLPATNKAVTTATGKSDFIGVLLLRSGLRSARPASAALDSGWIHQHDRSRAFVGNHLLGGVRRYKTWSGCSQAMSGAPGRGSPAGEHTEEGDDIVPGDAGRAVRPSPDAARPTPSRAS